MPRLPIKKLGTLLRDVSESAMQRVKNKLADIQRARLQKQAESLLSKVEKEGHVYGLHVKGVGKWAIYPHPRYGRPEIRFKHEQWGRGEFTNPLWEFVDVTKGVRKKESPVWELSEVLRKKPKKIKFRDVKGVMDWLKE